MGAHDYDGSYGTGEELGFALQQSPGLMLSVSSDDQSERDWAWKLAGEVVHARQGEFLIDEWKKIISYLREEGQAAAA